jgi:hypothetical protein
MCREHNAFAREENRRNNYNLLKNNHPLVPLHSLVTNEVIPRFPISVRGLQLLQGISSDARIVNGPLTHYTDRAHGIGHYEDIGLQSCLHLGRRVGRDSNVEWSGRFAEALPGPDSSEPLIE